MSSLSRPAALALLLLGMHPARADAPPPLPAERRSTLDDQRSVAVTIYSEDLALVKETRGVMLDRGLNRLALRDVSAHLRPETAQLRSLSQPGAFEVLEQNFDFDLLTPATLLEKYVGREVRVARVNPATGTETVEKAQVLSARDGVVLQLGDRVETGLPGRIVFDGVPPNLRDRPTLVTELNSKNAGAQTVELSYLTAGLSWKADYVAELNADDSSLDLNGWVTLVNQSGTAYPGARLQLVAGDVNRVQDEVRRVPSAEMMKTFAAPAPAPFAQENLFEYHLYTLERPTTLADNQTKQVALLAASAVPVSRQLRVEGSPVGYGGAAGEGVQTLKAEVFVEFENRGDAHLGQPLPKGVVRVYKRDRAGQAQFVGEDRIAHTPKNEKVRLHLGAAFDVTAERRQTDFRRRDESTKTGLRFESAYEIVIRNAKSEPVTVTLREPIPGDWTMLQESHPHAKADAGAAEWRVPVPAGGSVKVGYRVEVRG